MKTVYKQLFLSCSHLRIIKFSWKKLCLLCKLTRYFLWICIESKNSFLCHIDTEKYLASLCYYRSGLKFQFHQDYATHYWVSGLFKNRTAPKLAICTINAWCECHVGYKSTIQNWRYKISVYGYLVTQTLYVYRKLTGWIHWGEKPPFVPIFTQLIWFSLIRLTLISCY